MAIARPIVLGRVGNQISVRIPRAAYRGCECPYDPTVVEKQSVDSVTLLVSPAVQRGIEASMPHLSHSQRLAEASFIAALRHQYIWDVDVAIAAGAHGDRDGVNQWRAENHIQEPPSRWPSAWPDNVEHLLVDARRAIEQIRMGMCDQEAQSG